MDIPLPDAKKLVYFGPPWITWSNLEYTHPPIWLPVFIQRDSPRGAVGRDIPIRRSSVEIISSLRYITKEDPETKVCVVSDDTDVFALLLYFYWSEKLQSMDPFCIDIKDTF